jgi:hypothetical protein
MPFLLGCLPSLSRHVGLQCRKQSVTQPIAYCQCDALAGFINSVRDSGFGHLDRQHSDSNTCCHTPTILGWNRNSNMASDGRHNKQCL